MHADGSAQRSRQAGERSLSDRAFDRRDVCLHTICSCQVSIHARLTASSSADPLNCSSCRCSTRAPRHGYDLSKLIEARSGGHLKFHIDSLYPLLYRLEERGWIKGTWVEKPDERRRRFYKVTPEGRRVLAQQRKTWEAFVEAVRRVTGDEHA